MSTGIKKKFTTNYRIYYKLDIIAASHISTTVEIDVKLLD